MGRDNGFRNRIAHGYIDVNLDLVWDAVQRLPELQEAVDGGSRFNHLSFRNLHRNTVIR